MKTRQLLLVCVIGFMGIMGLTGCGQTPTDVTTVDELPQIYPDYIDVSVPSGMAPLNFEMAADDFDRMDVTLRGSKGGELHVSGEWADFDISDWQALTARNVGGQLTVSVCARRDGRWYQFRDFQVSVSPYPLDDWGLTYRLIKPGYEVGGDIGIYQRHLHSFDELPILTETAVPGRCMNCHTPNRGNPQQFTMQIRGEGGGTLVQKGDSQQWLDTKTDSLRAAGSYAYWHPSGDYCAYAASDVHQAFFVGTGQRIEVYHNFSHIFVLDTRSNEILASPLLASQDLEIFPAFSADGRWLYYSTSRPCRVPAEYERVKCSLCRISFDAATGTFGQTADTLLNGPVEDKSFTLARPSYDGRWLMYCKSSRSNFPVCQKDADLCLMDLRTGATRELTEVNSGDVESYHNWSTGSRWFVFTSKREDGMYAQLYLSSIDDTGHCTKPILLPQRQPKKFYREMMKSYNVPEFTTTRVSFDAHEAYRQVFNKQRIKVKIR